MGKLDRFMPYAVVAAAVGVAYLVFKAKKKTKGERARLRLSARADFPGRRSHRFCGARNLAGPFASSVGVGRAEPEWAAKNAVKGVEGTDRKYNEGERSEAPLPLGDEIMSGDLSTAPKEVDLLIVGAGLSGAVIAERCAKELGMSSLIIDVRDHIGGNCYDYVESHGLRASKYGAHLFHTKEARVWEYVKMWSQWMPFDHRVKVRRARATPRSRRCMCAFTRAPCRSRSRDACPIARASSSSCRSRRRRRR